MKKLSKVQVLGIVRHVLTFTGGILVAKGLINDSTMVELVGGIVAVVGMVWSIVSKNCGVGGNRTLVQITDQKNSFTSLVCFSKQTK